MFSFFLFFFCSPDQHVSFSFNAQFYYFPFHLSIGLPFCVKMQSAMCQTTEKPQNPQSLPLFPTQKSRRPPNLLVVHFLVNFYLIGEDPYCFGQSESSETNLVEPDTHALSTSGKVLSAGGLLWFYHAPPQHQGDPIKIHLFYRRKYCGRPAVFIVFPGACDGPLPPNINRTQIPSFPLPENDTCSGAADKLKIAARTGQSVSIYSDIPTR